MNTSIDKVPQCWYSAGDARFNQQEIRLPTPTSMTDCYLKAKNYVTKDGNKCQVVQYSDHRSLPNGQRECFCQFGEPITTKDGPLDCKDGHGTCVTNLDGKEALGTCEELNNPSPVDPPDSSVMSIVNKKGKKIHSYDKNNLKKSGKASYNPNEGIKVEFQIKTDSVDNKRKDYYIDAFIDNLNTPISQSEFKDWEIEFTDDIKGTVLNTSNTGTLVLKNREPNEDHHIVFTMKNDNVKKMRNHELIFSIRKEYSDIQPFLVYKERATVGQTVYLSYDVSGNKDDISLCIFIFLIILLICCYIVKSRLAKKNNNRHFLNSN